MRKTPSKPFPTKMTPRQSFSVTKEPGQLSQSTCIPKRQHFSTINPEDSSPQQLYKSIVEINRNYLSEKVSIGEVKKPAKYEHKLPSKTGSTEYHRRYGIGKRSITLPDSTVQPDVSGSKVKNPNVQITNLQSSYRADFSPQQKPIVPPASFQSKFAAGNIHLPSSNLPSFNQTIYSRDYYFRKSHNPAEEIRPKESIVLGGLFKGESVYQSNYKNKDSLKSQPTEPMIQKEHKIFVGVPKRHQSSYQSSYLRKEGQRQSSFRPIRNYLPSMQKVVRRTEYQKEYEGRTFNKEKAFEYMNNEQLHNYVMNLL